MMKKLTALLLALMLCLPALAETAAPMATPEPAPDPAELLSPYAIALPEGLTAQVSPGGASVTFTDAGQKTRVVVTVLDRVPDVDGDHSAELEKLMGQFAPTATSLTHLRMPEGCHALMAIAPGTLSGVNDTKVDQVIVMVLWQTPERGALMILSGYDLTGDNDRATAMMALLLQGASVADVPLTPAKETAE